MSLGRKAALQRVILSNFRLTETNFATSLVIFVLSFYSFNVTNLILMSVVQISMGALFITVCMQIIFLLYNKVE